MSKIGISVRIDVTKIDKSRLFKGSKGTYMDLTTFIDTENKDKYDNNGFITQTLSKEEKEQSVKTPILGNVKIFYTDMHQTNQNNSQDKHPRNQQPIPDDDIPF